jgi:hypothetical protein
VDHSLPSKKINLQIKTMKNLSLAHSIDGNYVQTTNPFSSNCFISNSILQKKKKNKIDANSIIKQMRSQACIIVWPNLIYKCFFVN